MLFIECADASCKEAGMASSTFRFLTLFDLHLKGSSVESKP